MLTSGEAQAVAKQLKGTVRSVLMRTPVKAKSVHICQVGSLTNRGLIELQDEMLVATSDGESVKAVISTPVTSNWRPPCP